MMNSIKIIILILVVSFSASPDLSAQVFEEVQFQHEGLTIYGTLTKPAGTTPMPAVIIGPGSGPNDRNATLKIETGHCLYPDLGGQTLVPYKELAEGLSRAGYAVLRYDKPEFTYQQQLGVITFAKLWLPLVSAIDYLKSRSDIDPDRVFLAGHSESSTFIPYVAQLRPGLRGLISIAGPRAPFDSILARQMRHFTALCGGDTAQANRDADDILLYYSLVRSGMAGLGPVFGVPADVWRQYMAIADSVSLHYRRAALPSLFLGFGQDLNVPVATELTRFRQELTTGVDFAEIGDLNHNMTPMNDPRVHQRVIDTIVHWLNARTGPVAVEESPDEETGISVSDGMLRISPAGAMESISISDILGRTLFRGDNPAAGYVIPVNAFVRGPVFIRIQTRASVYTRKLMLD